MSFCVQHMRDIIKYKINKGPALQEFTSELETHITPILHAPCKFHHVKVYIIMYQYNAFISCKEKGQK